MNLALSLESFLPRNSSKQPSAGHAGGKGGARRRRGGEEESKSGPGRACGSRGFPKTTFLRRSLASGVQHRDFIAGIYDDRKAVVTLQALG